MSERLKALREKRGVAVKAMRDAIDLAEQEKRDLTTEELAKHDELFKEVDGLRAQIDAEERTIEAERAAATKRAEDDDDDDDDEETKKKNKKRTEPLALKAFRQFLRTGRIAGEGEAELRQLQAGVDVEGGYLRAPQEVIASLLKGVDDAVFIRNRATKFTLPTAESLGVPSLDADVGDFDWTTELATGGEDTNLRFGKRELRPHPVAKQIKVSKTLLRVSALPIEQIIMDRFAYKFGITQEKAYIVGDGNLKPLGCMVASNDGIPSSRDVSTGNTTTQITFDGLVEAKHSVKANYWPTSDWLFHRDAVKQITKLKDGEGRPLWLPSTRDAEPDTILGRPMMISEYMPNTFATGLYVGLFGDFSQYWIVDALDLQVQRLVELYAGTNQDGFIARYEGDGAPVLPEAFARIKLA